MITPSVIGTANVVQVVVTEALGSEEQEIEVPSTSTSAQRCSSEESPRQFCDVLLGFTGDVDTRRTDHLSVGRDTACPFEGRIGLVAVEVSECPCGKCGTNTFSYRVEIVPIEVWISYGEVERRPNRFVPIGWI